MRNSTKPSPTNGKRPRGRPRQYDVERALSAAADVFWTNGFAGTSLDDLAAATGMNRPSLYAAFGDKREIYLATLRRYRDRSRAIALSLLADDPPLRTYLRRFYSVALDIYLDDETFARGCYLTGTAATQAAVDPAVRDFLAESIRRTDAFLADLIAKARVRGEIDARADPDVLARLANSILHTLAVRSRAGFPRNELQALADAAVLAICGAAPVTRGKARGIAGTRRQ